VGADAAEASETRRIYFNVSVPPEERDEEGRIRAKYVRNKIRTAKYTPLSFVPKNLWFQFHNIANIYFLFTVILSVSLLTKSLGLAFKNRLSMLMPPLPISDFPNLRSKQCRAGCRAPYCHSNDYGHQRCYRRLAEDYPGQ
jgi:hypothetical protein